MGSMIWSYCDASGEGGFDGEDVYYESLRMSLSYS